MQKTCSYQVAFGKIYPQNEEIHS